MWRFSWRSYSKISSVIYFLIKGFKGRRLRKIFFTLNCACGNKFNMHRRRGQSFHIPLYVLLLLLMVPEMVDILSVSSLSCLSCIFYCLEYDIQQYYASYDVIYFEVYWKLHFFRLKFRITLASSSWSSKFPKHTWNSMCICNLKTPHNV
jgi:hypothetical protein